MRLRGSTGGPDWTSAAVNKTFCAGGAAIGLRSEMSSLPATSNRLAAPDAVYAANLSENATFARD